MRSKKLMMPDHFEKAMQKYNYYKLNLGKPINLKENEKSRHE